VVRHVDETVLEGHILRCSVNCLWQYVKLHARRHKQEGQQSTDSGVTSAHARVKPQQQQRPDLSVRFLGKVAGLRDADCRRWSAAGLRRSSFTLFGRRFPPRSYSRRWRPECRPLLPGAGGRERNVDLGGTISSRGTPKELCEPTTARQTRDARTS